MNTKLPFVIVMIAALLSACVPNKPGAVNQPTVAVVTPVPPTNPVVTPALTATIPEAAPTQAPVPESVMVPMVVQPADHRLLMSSANITLSSAYFPAFTGLNSRGSIIGKKAYVLDFTNGPMVMAVDESGAVQLDFIQKPTYGLAVWAGEQPRLAWGTELTPEGISTLQMSAPDGSSLETLYTQEAATPPAQLVAQFWSADGKSLYFSREPVGLGGYILFAGASSLYKIDAASKQVTELIATDLSTGLAGCVDAVTLDHSFVADHCSGKSIIVRDLKSGGTTTIQPPEELADYRILGSARFSPDGSQVAFALAKGDPSGEQGWVAVSGSPLGSSKLVLTAPAGSFYTVIGWLNEQTLLLQSSPVPGGDTDNSLWTVNIDGSNLTKLSDGQFVAAQDKP